MSVRWGEWWKAYGSWGSGPIIPCPIVNLSAQVIRFKRHIHFVKEQLGESILGEICSLEAVKLRQLREDLVD